MLGTYINFHVVYFLFPRVGNPMRTQFPVEYGLTTYDVIIRKLEKKEKISVVRTFDLLV